MHKIKIQGSFISLAVLEERNEAHVVFEDQNENPIMLKYSLSKLLKEWVLSEMNQYEDSILTGFGTTERDIVVEPLEDFVNCDDVVRWKWLVEQHNKGHIGTIEGGNRKNIANGVPYRHQNKQLGSFI